MNNNGILRDIVPEGLLDEQKVKIMYDYFKKICTQSDNNLTIVDAYIFYNNNSSYENLLIKVLTFMEFKSIRIITHHFNSELFRSIKGKMPDNIEIDCYISKDFHDRYWISNESKKGFIVGTSLDMIGDKVSLMQMLEDDESKQILEYIDQKIKKKNYKKQN